MTRYRTFSAGDRFPADFPDALGDFLGSAALNFQVIIKPGTTTTLQVPAGADNAKVAISINGRWRYNVAPVERASPGGAARTMDVHVTGSDNVFTAGGGGEVDSTVYAFALAITDAGGTPAGVALSRKVGTAVWDGSKFTSLTQTVPPLPTFPLSLIGAARVPPLVTSLPAGPADGDEIEFLADPANGVVWRFRYRAASSSAHKWEFVGGPPLVSSLAVAPVDYAFSVAYADLTGFVPLSVAVAGDYDIRLTASIIATTGTPHIALMAALAVGGGAVSDLNAVQWNLNDTAEASGSLWRRFADMTAGETVRVDIRSASGAQIVPLAQMYFEVGLTPVRVG